MMRQKGGTKEKEKEEKEEEEEEAQEEKFLRTGRDGPTEGSTRGPRGPKTKLDNTKYIVKVKVPVNARENFV